MSGTTYHEGDCVVSRNFTVGGDAILRGQMQVDSGLHVKGWLTADNMNLPTVGVYIDVEALEANNPSPREGLVAGVLTIEEGVPTACQLWRSSTSAPNGWVDTGATIPITLDLSVTSAVIDPTAFEEWKQQIETAINGKIDKVRGPNTLNFPMLNSIGGIVNGDKGPSDFATAEQGDKADVSEDARNKVTEFQPTPDDRHYPSEKMLYTLASQLGVQAAYFAGFKEAGGTIVNERYDRASPRDYRKLIYYDEANHCFYYKDVENNRYYTKWGEYGELAFMTETGAVLTNKLYVDADGKTYYCNYDDSNYVLKKITIDLSLYALKSEMAISNVPGENDKKNIQLSNDLGHNVNVLVAHQDISGKAEKSEMSVSTAAGISTITLKTGTVASAYTPDAVNRLLGRAVGEAVRVEFEVPADNEYSLCSEDFDAAKILLVVVNGVGYIDPTDVYMESTRSQIVTYVFADSSKIPANAFIGLDGLQGRLSLKSVHIPSYVHEIGEKAFFGSTNLGAIDCEAITPPTIGAGAFADVDMSSVTLTVHRLCQTAYTDGGNWAGVGRVNNY